MKTLDRLISGLARSRSKLLLRLAAALLPFAIAACGSGGGVIGNGIGPDHLVVAVAGAPGATSFQTYECFHNTLTATLFFTDGSSGDFTSRVVWSSSSPGTVSVSNGDQPMPAGGFYAHGTVTTVGGGGPVTVTANYFGITASIDISVGTPRSLTIKRTIQGNAVLPPALPASQVRANGNSLISTGFSMGIGSTETLSVVANLDGQEQTVQSPGVDWHFQVPNDGEATIVAATGVITGVTAGPPLIAVVSFDSCTYTASTQVTVANVTSISAFPEFQGDPTAVPAVPQPPLVINNTEKINVYANLSDGTTQDISQQATLVSSDTTVLQFATVGGITNIAKAVAAGGPVNISAMFTQGGSQLLTSTNVQITTVIGTLESIKLTSLARPPNNLVTPQPADTVPPDCSSVSTAQFDDPNQPTAVVFIGSTIPLQFCVLGSYNGGTIRQDITRQINWTLSDTTLAKINGPGTPQTAGQAFATGTQIGTILVTPVAPSATISNQIMMPLTISN